MKHLLYTENERGLMIGTVVELPGDYTAKQFDEMIALFQSQYGWEDYNPGMSINLSPVNLRIDKMVAFSPPLSSSQHLALLRVALADCITYDGADAWVSISDAVYRLRTINNVVMVAITKSNEILEKGDTEHED